MQYYVYLERMGRAADDTPVVFLYSSGTADMAKDAPGVRWTGNSVLKISVPRDAAQFIDIKKSRDGQVRIKYTQGI
ncbi:MAG TPA: hypothetical protein VFL13_06930 [Candidatus Baltobacteraceae bacterium]|nr:hypothetical protein [Candidatus Baltobacteraceae bacterium]